MYAAHRLRGSGEQRHTAWVLPCMGGPLSATVTKHRCELSAVQSALYVGPVQLDPARHAIGLGRKRDFIESESSTVQQHIPWRGA